MITPQQGMAFLRQMQANQAPGGGGIGAPPALGPDGKPSPTQGLIARMMSDNPGGLIGALMKQNDPNQPGSMASTGAGPLPALPPGGMPDPSAGPAAPQPGMLAGLLAKLKGQQPGAPGGMPPMMPQGAPAMPNLDAMTNGPPPVIGGIGGLGG